MLVSIQRRFQFTALGQGVAAIVVGPGVAALGETFGGRGILAGLVQRHPLPLRVLEMLGGGQRLLLAEQVQALLIRAQPQVVELEGLARLRQHEQQRQAQQPAPAPGAGGEQQQR
ncbi:hypothetical protein D3C81_2018240 [compost metagenome]